MLNGLDKIDLSAPDAVDQINALAQGLIDKKTELEGKIVASKDGNAATAAELEGLRAFKSNSELKATEDAASYQEAKELTATAHLAELAKLNERISVFEQGERSRLITDGASKQMTELNVNPLHMQAQMALITSMSEIVDGKAMIGDQTQSEYIKAWSETDSGKASIIGQQNQNGDGLGGSNSQQEPQENQQVIDAKASGNLRDLVSAQLNAS
jgi:hypothetical protein